MEPVPGKGLQVAGLGFLFAGRLFGARFLRGFRGLTCFARFGLGFRFVAEHVLLSLFLEDEIFRFSTSCLSGKQQLFLDQFKFELSTILFRNRPPGSDEFLIVRAAQTTPKLGRVVAKQAFLGFRIGNHERSFDGLSKPPQDWDPTFAFVFRKFEKNVHVFVWGSHVRCVSR